MTLLSEGNFNFLYGSYYFNWIFVYCIFNTVGFQNPLKGFGSYLLGLFKMSALKHTYIWHHVYKIS